MKKLLFILTILTSFTAFSQTQFQNSIIKLTPEFSQGYLVLSKADYPQVSNWQLNIIERTPNADGTTSDQVVQQLMLPDNINYKKIPSQYLNGTSTAQYLVNVKGFSRNNTEIIDENPHLISTGPPLENLCPGCTGYEQGCYWTCESDYYAYRIQQWIHPQGAGSYYSLDKAFEYFDEDNQVGIPYYVYMSETEFNNWCGSGSNSCLNGVTYIGPLSTSGTTYVNSVGQVITGGVAYGVVKNKGPWEGADNYLTPILSQGDGACMFDINWAMNLMNTYVDWNIPSGGTYPNLYCNPAFSNSNSMLPNSGGPECLNTAANFELDYSWDLYTMLDQLAACLCEGGYSGGFGCDGINPGGSGTTWPSAVNHISIRDLNDGSVPPVFISADALIKSPAGDTGSNNGNSNGNNNWKGPQFPLNPSLYAIGISYADGSYLPLVKEVKKKVRGNLPKEKFLQATVSPVPVMGNQLNLDMTADQKLRFDYELYDFNGNMIHQEQFDLKKDENISKTIAPNSGIPTGILINKFKFVDGSTKSIEIIKN